LELNLISEFNISDGNPWWGNRCGLMYAVDWEFKLLGWIGISIDWFGKVKPTFNFLSHKNHDVSIQNKCKKVIGWKSYQTQRLWTKSP